MITKNIYFSLNNNKTILMIQLFYFEIMCTYYFNLFSGKLHLCVNVMSCDFQIWFARVCFKSNLFIQRIQFLTFLFSKYDIL